MEIRSNQNIYAAHHEVISSACWGQNWGCLQRDSGAGNGILLTAPPPPQRVAFLNSESCLVLLTWFMTPLTVRMRARIPTSLYLKYDTVAVPTEPDAYCLISFQREFEISNFMQFCSAVAHLLWVWNLVVDIAGGKEAEGVWEHCVEENIWT